MNRSELLNTLKLAQPALLAESELVLPILKNFRFDNGQVLASNDVISVCLEADIGQEAIVSGRKLTTFLSSCRTKEVKFSLTQKKSLVVKCGQSKMIMPTEDPEDWPFEFPDIEVSTSFDVGPSFFEALKICTDQSPDTGTGSWVGGITLVFKDGVEIYGVGKSRSTISYCKVSDVATPKKTTKALVPSSFCKAAVAMSKNFEGDAVLHVTDQGVVITWEDERHIIFGKRLNIDAPDIAGRVKDILAEDIAYSALTDPLKDAIKRAGLLGENGNCVVSGAENGLTIKARSGGGVLNETIEIEGLEIPDEEIRIAADLVAKRLGDCAEIGFADTSVVMRSESGDFAYLVANRGDEGEEG